MIERKIIDSHGHFGKSFMGPESSISLYVNEAKKIGVVASIASPGPTPEIIDGSVTTRPCLWEVNEGVVSYFRQEINSSTGEDSKSTPDVNPYHGVNMNLISEAQKHNKRDVEHKILAMPIHQPFLDTKDEIESLLKHKDVIALKLHGISTFTGPNDVSQNTVDSLKRFDKPIIVHTDMYRGEVKFDIHRAYQLNHPLSWVNWARDNKVKTLITHGARLSAEALKLIDSTPNVAVGLSPDLLLMSEQNRLDHNSDEFLFELFSLVSPQKILFDIDYGWNVTERNNWEKSDWKMCERINSAALRAGLSQNDLDNIYFNNAVKFYNI